MRSREPQTYPPSAPMAFDSVPTCTSTRPCTPKWSMVPRPLRPSTPEACASSTIMMAPYFSASAHSPGSGPISPSMEKTPSVISSLCPGWSLTLANCSSAWARSLWRKTRILARESRAPSMMLAWFSSSEMMKSSLSRMAETVPALAANPGLEDDAGLDVLESRDALLQFHVNAHGAGDGAHRARADAVLARGLQRGLAQLGVGRQAEIVVGGQVDHLPAVEMADRRLLVVQYAQAEVGSFLLQAVEFFAKIGELRA